MLDTLLAKVVGTQNERELKRLRPLVDPRRFRLEQAGDAHRLVESGTATGKVVVDVAEL